MDVKKAINTALMVGVAFQLAMPAWAQRGGHGRGAMSSAGVRAASSHHLAVSSESNSLHSQKVRGRSNRHGRMRGLERAEQVQNRNTRADANRGFTVAPGVERAERHAVRRNAGRHHRGTLHIRKIKRHRRNRDAQGKDRDRDRGES